MPQKECTTCHKIKPISQFYSDGGSHCKYGVRNKCKVCCAAHQRAHPRPYNPNRIYYPEKNRLRKLKTKFNISLTQYEKMLKRQHRVCALCDRPERVKNRRNGKIKHLGVDHSHITGKVRALLCQDCNLLIGKIEDSPIILKKIKSYLRKYK